MALLRFSATVGGYTLISRILGYVRDILIANILGAGAIADAFFVAFKIPNLLRRLFAEGAFNLAFVPLFAGKLEGEGREKAMLFAEQAFAMLFYSLLVLVALAEATMPWLMYVLAPGFADDPAKFELAIALTRISFPYILFISLVSLLGGILNSMHRFAAAAAAPILLNICLIAALIGLARTTETPGHALAIGVSGAGVIQLAFLYGVCRRAGISIRLRLPRLSPEVKRLFVLMAPVAIGAGVAQIGVLIDMIFASHIEGAVSFLYYADRVNQLPLGVIGVAIGTALLPMMTRELKAGGDGVANQNRAMEAALLFALPAAVALMVIAEPLMVVLFERGAFDARASAMSANALIAYAGGLPAFVLIKVLVPAFFAREEPKVPVRIAILCVIANVGLNGILIWPLGHVGVALATSLSGWLNVALLLKALGRRGYYRPDARLKRRIPRMILAAAVMAGLVWLLIWAFGDVFHATLPVRVGALTGLVVSGLIAYAALGRLVGAARLGELRALFRKESGA